MIRFKYDKFEVVAQHVSSSEDSNSVGLGFNAKRAVTAETGDITQTPLFSV